MGRIIERIKQDVFKKFKEQIDKTDIEQIIADDELSFKIKRADGVILYYDGESRKYNTK
jgi:hypothetical protein